MKHITGNSTYQQIFVSIVILFSLGLVPAQALAQTVSTQTAQLLPPGGNSCAQVSATGFTPYIYDGALHSFDVTIADPSYVAIVASVGDLTIPFHYITRRIDAAGQLRTHVDIDTIAITGTLPVTVTLLSAKGQGQPVCALIVSASVGTGAIQNVSAGAGTVPSGETSSSGTPSGMTETRYGAYSKGKTVAVSEGKKPSNTSSATASPATSSWFGGTTSSGTVARITQTFGNACASTSSAIGLWIILLVLYAILVAALLWASWPTSWKWIKTPEWMTAGILVPLILLLAFWYAVASCRGAWWLPVLAVAIAIAGLFAAFWNHPRVKQLLLSEQKKA